MRITTLAVSLALCAASALSAQAPQKPMHPTHHRTAKEATISLDSATAIATRAVPDGHVTHHAIEHSKGKLIYSFDVSVTGKAGYDKVHVDGTTGAVLSNTHEGGSAEMPTAPKKSSHSKTTPKPPAK